MSSSWVVQAMCGVRWFRRLLQYDAELAGSLESSGSTVPVLQSAPVLCRIACDESNNVNSGNRTVYASIGLCQNSTLLSADGAHMLMSVCVGHVQKVGCARRVRLRWCRIACAIINNINSSNTIAYVSMGLCPIGALKCVVKAMCGMGVGADKRSNIEVLFGTTGYFGFWLCTDGAHLLVPPTISVAAIESLMRILSIAMAEAESSEWSSRRHPCSGEPEDIRMGISSQCVVVVWYNWIFRHVVRSVTGASQPSVHSDKQPMCRRCCSVQLVYSSCAECYRSLAGVRAFRPPGQDDAELAGSLNASGRMVPVHKYPLVLCRIPCAQSNNLNSLNRIAYAPVRLVKSGRPLLNWQVVCTPVAVRFLCFKLRWCCNVVLHVLKATISIASTESLMLCTAAAHLLMPVCVGDFQQVGCESHMRLCADGAHLLMPVCVGHIQLVGCAGHVGNPVEVLFVCLNLLWCRRVVSHVFKAIMSIQALESFMLCANAAHLLMPISSQCVGGVVWYNWTFRLVVRSNTGESLKSRCKLKATSGVPSGILVKESLRTFECL
ncbi:hypothetical protein cyc_06379 [Cyclospora cayetanensis]|uniref:Uncharacterized protein n=1 Tax=Cyclospora cayetanensis TaxID=88456 RepID=A0A1D3CUB3_9EIME|nr:hypothetical protein cyc_06379 [Cyclospora cayetanensis]